MKLKMFNLFLLLGCLGLIVSCGSEPLSPKDKRKKDFESCIIRLVNNEVPPLKAMEICKEIHKAEKDSPMPDAPKETNATTGQLKGGSGD